MTIDIKKPVRTKAREDVTELAMYPDIDRQYPICGRVGNIIRVWTLEGIHCSGYTSLLDLENFCPGPDHSRPLDELAKEIRVAIADNGFDVFQIHQWDDAYKIPALTALIHTEVAGATEAFHNDDIENFLEEMADVVLRVFNVVGGFSQSFDQIVRDKIEKNKTRPYRHGGKRI